MEFLGKVEEITCDGRLIIQCRSLPDLGDSVFDQRQNKIGIIGKVFGPVSEPYVSVTVSKERGPVPKNTELFFKGRNQNGKGKGRNRRN